MALYITSLNSGSNGNCYYIGNETEAILIDAGISGRETERRMKRLGLAMDLIKGIFISHEHIDHITGIAALSRKFQFPVYITEATQRATNLPIDDRLICRFVADEVTRIGELSITAFVKSHDAVDPHSFVVGGNDVRIGVFTDIGYCCERVVKYFSGCDAIFLEANYCEDMLRKGNYPYHLQRRISGRQGHLSNTQALELFLQHRGNRLSHLILSHLSKNNNSPELVDRLFREHAGPVKVTVASRYAETPLFEVTPQIMMVPPRRSVYKPPVQQLSLFE